VVAFMRNSLLRPLKPSIILLWVTVIFLPACDKNDEAGADIGLTAAPTELALKNSALTRDAKIRQAVIEAKDASPINTADEVTALRPSKKKTKKKKETLVIGKTIKTGMSLETALSKLGIPRSIRIHRGTEPETDSISVEYLNQGLRIHALTRNSTIEEVEVLPGFKGSFLEGAKIGSKFPKLIESFGIPKSKDSSIAKYPHRGMYIFLKNDTMISAKLFAKNSKLLDHKLLIN